MQIEPINTNVTSMSHYFGPLCSNLESSGTDWDPCNTCVTPMSHECHTLNPIIDISGAISSHFKEMETHVIPMSHTYHTVNPIRHFWSNLKSFKRDGDLCSAVSHPCPTYDTSMSHSRHSFRPFWSISKSFRQVEDPCNIRVTPMSQPRQTVNPIIDTSAAI